MYLASAVIFLSATVLAVLGESVGESENGVCENKGDSCEKYAAEVDNDVTDPKYDVKVFTVSSATSDGFQRFNRSAFVNKIEVRTLVDIDSKHDEIVYSRGGYKLNILKRALRNIKTKEDVLVLYTESDDVIITQPLADIARKFLQSGAGILFAAQTHLPGDQTTQKHLYPTVDIGSRFLNAGMFIGYLSKVSQLLSSRTIRNSDCNEQIIGQAYLDPERRSELNLQLDHRSEVFQSLNGAIADVSLEKENGQYILLNTAHKTQPSLIQGNGPSKLFINNYGNYLAGSFVDNECVPCGERQVALASDDSDLPTVTMAVIITKATPFFAQFLNLVRALDYPKRKMDLFVHTAVPEYSAEIVAAVEASGYASFRQSDSKGNETVDEAMARNMAVSHAIERNNDYFFVIDADARLNNSQTLRELMRQNRTIIAPMLTRYKEGWSNFWGALSERGYYARSHDYISIVDGDIRGIWNVPYVSSCYLAKKSVLTAMRYYDSSLEPDMAMCQSLRDQGIFMHVSNQLPFGHLANADDYNPLLTRPDLYTMLTNPLDWEHQYIHADYAAQLRPNRTHAQPCPDVFWFPIVTERFAADLIAVMEAYGKFSDGSEKDERLKGGYEAVPTRDVHMGQVGLEEIWGKFLKKYVRPLQEQVYKGYFSNAEALMNFVVRYKPTEQPFLKPHHDTSTYTINIALNRAGIDYKGGGCRFLRYNCSVTDTKVGHMLMHPGRLTHYHEGLYVTEGTRYIMVSFVDPE